MNYIEKIRKSFVPYAALDAPSETVPHQSYTPREILKQFVLNDVQVMRLKATDELYTFDEDAVAAQNSVIDFEDEFQARDYMRNHYKSKSSSESSNERFGESSPDNLGEDSSESSPDKSGESSEEK